MNKNMQLAVKSTHLPYDFPLCQHHSIFVVSNSQEDEQSYDENMHVTWITSFIPQPIIEHSNEAIKEQKSYKKDTFGMRSSTS